MCTVSWIYREDGFELFCNRDEKRTRKPAAPPRVYVRDGLRFAAPVDGDAGGSWIAVNETGTAICLLNGPAAPGRALRSRGLLVNELISLGQGGEVAGGLLAADLAAYAAFRIAILAPGGPRVFRWDGDCLQEDDARSPLLSSSFDPAGVLARRRRIYEAFAAGASPGSSDWLRRFHCSHGWGPGPDSPCMHRPDAETVSFTHVRVAGRRIDMSYVAGAPCRWGEAVYSSL